MWRPLTSKRMNQVSLVHSLMPNIHTPHSYIPKPCWLHLVFFGCCLGDMGNALTYGNWIFMRSFFSLLGMFVSGSRDGSIHVWDTRCAMRGSQHKPVNSISGAHKKANDVLPTTDSKRRRQRGQRSAGLSSKSGDTKHSVTAVLFHGNHTIASCGTADGYVPCTCILYFTTHIHI